VNGYMSKAASGLRKLTGWLFVHITALCIVLAALAYLGHLMVSLEVGRCDVSLSVEFDREGESR
jgi:hypothetical protein